MQQLSATDASFVYLETPTTPMHIGSVAIYDPSTAPNGLVRYKDILRHIEARLHTARSFRQRLVQVPGNLDHPYWIEDPDFDIEFHVRHIALPAPGDWRQLCIVAARIHARPLDMAKPLWEFTIIEGLDNIPGLPKGSFALLSKVHHAAIDGMSGVDMTSGIHSTAPDAPPPAEDKPWKPDARPGAGELLFRSYINSIGQPLRMAQVVANSVPGFAKLGVNAAKGEISLAGLKPAPKTRLNGKVSAHRVFEGRAFSLRDVKTMRTLVDGATVNDVMLAVVGGALRKYLDSKGELPAETMMAMAPISVRAEGEKGAMGNLVSAMIVALGTDIADPVERLKSVRASALNSKAMTQAVGAKTLSEYSAFMPSALAGLGARLYTRLGLAQRVDQAFNCVVTNVPGPRVPLFMAGAKMVLQMGTGPIFDGMGMIMPVYSYGDTIAISFTSDRKMIPDPAFYADCLQASFDEMLAAGERNQIAPVPPGSPVPTKKPPAKPAAPTKTKPLAKPLAKTLAKPLAKAGGKPRGRPRKVVA
jgi:WS/DGAT/MGAT family acyltransferase